MGQPVRNVFTLVHGPCLRVLPIVHDRAVYAQALYAELASDAWRPDVVAVDLPASFEPAIREGLELGEGPIWVSRGLESVADVLPLERGSGYRNTSETVAAVRQAILQIRRLSAGTGGRGSTSTGDWLEDPFVGFEPVVFLFRDATDEPATMRKNIASPDRRYLYSLGFYDEPIPEGPGRLRRPTLGRVWLAPPAEPAEERARVRWYDDGMGDRMPSAFAHTLEAPYEDWTGSLVALAADAAGERFFVVADLACVDRDGLEAVAHARGKRIVFVDIDAIELDVLRTIESNRYYREGEAERAAARASEPIGEAYALDRGDAAIEAIRWAIEHDKEVAFVDRELFDEAELRQLQLRPPARTHDDALLPFRGIERHYQALQVDLEATRLVGLDATREAAMAADLSRLLEQGNQVLFVCGMAHWRPIAEALDGGVVPAATEERGTSVAPAVPLWAGALPLGVERGDPMCVAADFRAARSVGLAARFSYAASVASMQERIRKRMTSEGLGVGRIQRFERMIERVCPGDGSVVPGLAQLSEVGAATLPREKRQIVPEEAAVASVSCPPGLDSFADCGIDEDNAEARLASRWQGSRDLVTHAPDDRKRRNRTRVQRMKRSGSYRTQPDWDLFVAGLHARAVELSPIGARLGSEATHVLRGRLDMRRSIRARARGDDRWYSRSIRELPDGSHDLFESFAPVLFDLGIRSTDRWECLHADNWPSGPVIGMAITRRRTRHEWVLGGLAVFSPSLSLYDEERTRRWMRWGQRRDPLTISEVFSYRRALREENVSPREALTSLMLAASDGDAVVVTDGWSDPELRARSKCAGRRLHRVPLARFDPGALASLRQVGFDPPGRGA